LVCSYCDTSVVDLSERIARDADRLALRELLDHRQLFRFSGGPPLSLAQFVARLSETLWARRLADGDERLLQDARDLTMDKFTLIPHDDRAEGKADGSGPDCRFYYRSFLMLYDGWCRDNPSANALDQEASAAGLLQTTIVRHFRLSCLEARRNGNPARSRYVWHVNSGTIDLWMPTWVAGRSRRAWLDAHVDDPTPGRPGEEHRVQAIIDAELGVPRHVRFDSEDAPSLADRRDRTPLRLLIEQEITLHGLPDVIAKEKAEKNLHKQRPAIRALGGPMLKRLILQIFDDLRDGRYEEKHLAQAFGLSRPTLSRFAGSRWKSRSSTSPPDLWLNVARTLASHAALTEAAKEAGVWQQVQRTLETAR
jgi:hypothetical protein